MKMEIIILQLFVPHIIYYHNDISKFLVCVSLTGFRFFSQTLNFVFTLTFKKEIMYIYGIKR